MTYALRLWVNNKLEESATAPTATPVLERFREIVAEWPHDWRHVRWSVSVNAEPGPFPARSYPIAIYQHVPTR